MISPDHEGSMHGERLIQGADTWWFLGPGGIARVQRDQLTPDGRMRAAAERHLRSAGLFDPPPYRAYSLTVLTSTDCNLGCGYCFQNTSQDPMHGTRPPRITHARLTPRTIQSVLAFAASRMTEARLERLHLMLFGGEPLLNPKGCRDLLAAAADYGLSSAAMTTNGVLLTPALARQLGDLGLTSVQVTFDGDLADHDRIRVRRSGGGTFGAIVRNIADACEVTDMRWSLRVNVSHRNRAGIDDLLDRLAGTLDAPRCSIYFALVGDVGIGYANEVPRTGELAADFARWYGRALELGFRIPRPGANQPCQACSYQDGRYGAVVNADGTLYSCWETTGQPGWEVGTVTDGYLSPARTRDRWISCADRYRLTEDSVAQQTFRDAVDAAVLDQLSLAGQL
jgi:uncharacterized protein